MSKLRLYLSYSAQDQTFAERLARTLRGAGADVWFDVHLQDSSLPSGATRYELLDHRVLVLVLSPAVLASRWVGAEFSWFFSSYRTALGMQERYLLHLRSLDERLAAIYDEGSTYTQRHIFPVLIDPVSRDELAGEWQPLSRLEWIAGAGDRPYPEDEAILRALRRAGACVPQGAMRATLAEAMFAWNEHLPEDVRPTYTLEDILASFPEPLDTEPDPGTLLERGRQASLAVDAGDEARTTPAVWCLVANVTEEQLPGVGGQGLRRGTKHFAPGAKVYCLVPGWGDGYERMIVVGRHRDTDRYVKMVVPSKRLTNWHADLVYSPYVIAQLEGEWDGTQASRHEAERLATMFREREAAR